MAVEMAVDARQIGEEKLIFRMIIMCVALVLVPGVVGAIFYPLSKGGNRLLFGWIAGQLLLWAGFELTCVPMILLHKEFGQLTESFLFYVGALILFSAGFCMRRRCKGAISYYVAPARNREENKAIPIMWILFGVLLALQLFLVIFLSYQEGDDAFFVSISTASIDSNQMYQKDPYVGGTTTLDIRHALAPYPIFVSVLAKLFAVPAIVVAHVGLPLVMIPMAYAMFYLCGERLLEGRRQNLAFFMVLVELLVLFGGYSVYTSENFLLVRSAQGKAVLGSIIIPFLTLLLYLLLERLNKKEPVSPGLWVLLAILMTAGCLCSTLGTFLLCMLSCIVAGLAVYFYRKWTFLIPLTLCMMIPIGFAGLYFWLS